jgi:MEDS: MEthanogen/methylotroph, DcmR Sensory domain
MRERKIPLGITDDEVALGSHLVHFWKTDDEFEIGVRFLQLGVGNETEYCVLFGHDEANQHVLEILRKTCHDFDRALQEGRLVILRRDSSASVTQAKIEDVFSSALRKGATAIRYLGNLGMGRDALPGRGANEVIELETGVTALALRYPCVMVCMYDVNTVSGHLLLASGFATHPLAVWNDELRQNPYCDSEMPASHHNGRVA